MGKLYTGLFFEAFPWGRWPKFAKSFTFEVHHLNFLHNSLKSTLVKIFLSIQEQELDTIQAVTGLGQELSYILLTPGGDNSIASPDILSTSNSSDTCDIPGSLLQQRGPLGRQASIC